MLHPGRTVRAFTSAPPARRSRTTTPWPHAAATYSGPRPSSCFFVNTSQSCQGLTKGDGFK
jgi:hypothetical protein